MPGKSSHPNQDDQSDEPPAIHSGLDRPMPPPDEAALAASRGALRADIRPVVPTASSSTEVIADEEDDGEGAFDIGDGLERPLALRSKPGHDVIDRAEIRAALKSCGYDGSFDALSSGEEQRARTLVQLQSADLWRPHLVGTQLMLARLDQLSQAQANFAAVIGLVRKAVHLSTVAGTAINVPPILMLGGPGIGKSRFARGLARCLGTDLSIINGSTIPDVGSITGYTPVWRGASQGRLSKFIVSARNTSPLVFIDEAEKISDYENVLNPLDRMLAVLERLTASTFQDENLQVNTRAENVIFLFACNSVVNLSEPFLDRVVTIHIPDLGREKRDEVLEAMLGEVTEGLGFALSFASRAVLEPLHALGLRRARLALQIAVAHAVGDGRRFITKGDLLAATTLLERPGEQRRTMGFIHP